VSVKIINNTDTDKKVETKYGLKNSYRTDLTGVNSFERFCHI